MKIPKLFFWRTPVKAAGQLKTEKYFVLKTKFFLPLLQALCAPWNQGCVSQIDIMLWSDDTFKLFIQTV